MSLATGLIVVVLPAVLLAILLVPALRRAVPRVLRQPAFVAVAVLLGVGAVGLNAATNAMRLHFRKLPVPLAAPLDDVKRGIPTRLGHWVQVSKDEPLDHSIQEALGTKDFVFRDYVDTRVIGAADVAWFADRPTAERNARLAAIQAQAPEAVVRLAVTYYTGLVDTVPHVPERCYVADGFDAAAAETIKSRLAAPGAAPDAAPRDVSYRYLYFQDTTGTGRVDRQVAYLFRVNGEYASSSLGVRQRLQNLLQRYGYFAKVELMTTARSHAGSAPDVKAHARAKSVAAFEDLLAALLPEVERCLPDWAAVTARKPE